MITPIRALILLICLMVEFNGLNCSAFGGVEDSEEETKITFQLYVLDPKPTDQPLMKTQKELEIFIESHQTFIKFDYNIDTIFKKTLKFFRAITFNINPFETICDDILTMCDSDETIKKSLIHIKLMNDMFFPEYGNIRFLDQIILAKEKNDVFPCVFKTYRRLVDHAFSKIKTIPSPDNGVKTISS